MRVSSRTALQAARRQRVGKIAAFSRSQNVERDAQLAHVAFVLGVDRLRESHGRREQPRDPRIAATAEQLPAQRAVSMKPHAPA
jgi:hypothetical protein